MGNANRDNMLVMDFGRLVHGDVELCADHCEFDGNNRSFAENCVREIEAIERSGKWDTLVCLAPLGGSLGVDKTLSFVRAAVDAITPGGRLIITLFRWFMVSGNPEVAKLRSSILDTCRINNVVKLSNNRLDIRGLYLVDLRHGEDSGLVNYYVDDGRASTDELVDSIKEARPTFTTTQEELSERWDSDYLDPRFGEMREMRRAKNTVRLGEIADVIPGIPLKPKMGAQRRDCIIVGAGTIVNGHFDPRQLIDWYADIPEGDEAFLKAVLRKGDIIVRCFVKIQFAEYRDIGRKAVAGQPLRIIRPLPGFEELVRLYFSTKLGEDSFNAQSEMLCGRDVTPKLTEAQLKSLVVPDIEALKLAAEMQKKDSLLDRMTLLFESEGWEVLTEHSLGRDVAVQPDMLLRTNGRIVGAVEARAYERLDDASKRRIAQNAKECLEAGGIELFLLFVGDRMYRYEAGKFYRAPDIPTPENYRLYQTDKELYTPLPA